VHLNAACNRLSDFRRRTQRRTRAEQNKEGMSYTVTVLMD